ncbi:MAG TPA: hypothetical protein VN605_05885 [Thermoanaerobaculia bacterium]|nr:hypothetical protein [Thermoanaerobaculia bacterium]
MAERLMELLQTVTDETSFNRFLVALREECESHERDCRGPADDCIQNQHWEAHSTKDFLKSMEGWAVGGDFAAGVHHGEPLLRRIATMLYVGKYIWPS